MWIRLTYHPGVPHTSVKYGRHTTGINTSTVNLCIPTYPVNSSGGEQYAGLAGQGRRSRSPIYGCVPRKEVFTHRAK